MALTRLRPRPRGTDLLPAPPRWATQALCARIGRPGDWYPDEDDHDATAAAIEVCERCPVRTACLEAAMASRWLEHGIWGGATRADRRRLRRNRKNAARKAAAA
ncbi:WhiB family transcriptional regulator [Nocardiopsis sp. NPDC057823]|uniref:WhiB family transcriptional regulator n=1 Tax=Nocardiopsis sp. NPDC057823 TaxID=3346256 RepID=UPI003670CA16